MKRLLKICDLYGTKFHWYIGYKPKYYSFYGGIFSILSFLSWIFIFAIFGFDDFKRTHPIISSSTIPPNGYKNIKFGKQKLYLPWRIVDYDEKPLNHKGIVYPKIYYFTSKYSKKTGAMKTTYSLINYKLCNETSMINLGKEFLLDIAIEDLYCIDMEDLNMGGSWNADFMNYIRFDLYLCKDGIDYNESNSNCTTYDKFDELHGKDNSWFFEILYPVVQFQPTEQNIPVLILYKTYYYIFSRYSNKVDRIYLQEHILEDEQGWILSNPQNSSYWGTFSIGGENYVTGEKDLLKMGSNSRLYSLKIYLNLGITYYTRKYKKLYEILSEIFPMVRAVISFFTFLSDIVNELNSTKKINEYIIGIDNRKERKIRIKNRQQFSNDLKISIYSSNYDNKVINIDLKKINEKSSKQEEQNNDNSKIENKSNLDESSNIICVPKDSKSIKRSQKSFNSLRLELKQRNMNVNNSVNATNTIFEGKVKFPLYYYFLGFLLIKLKSKKFKKSHISTKFTTSFLIFTHIIDISSYISLYKQFEMLKKLAINKLKVNEHEIKSKENALQNNKSLIEDKYSHKDLDKHIKKKFLTVNK